MRWDENLKMTDINHHLTDALLMAYSAGSLPEGFGLVVASHISMCDECRARMESFDALGGTILENTEDTALAPESFGATLERIAKGAAAAPAPPAPKERPTIFPGPLVDYVGGDLDQVKWRSYGIGLKQALLPVARGSTVRLLYIPAGMAVPDHGHRGTELTLVLQGAFHDESDHFGPGDIEVADQDVFHTPTADQGQPCICLAATDAPLRFKDLLPRIAQPFLRI